MVIVGDRGRHGILRRAAAETYHSGELLKSWS